VPNPAGGDVPVVYGAFERLALPAGATYFVRTVDIEGDVRVQGFRLNPGGLRAELGNQVLEAQRTSDSATVMGASGARMHLLPAGSTFDPRSGVARLRR
jgi:hypothetical protein